MKVKLCCLMAATLASAVLLATSVRAENDPNTGVNAPTQSAASSNDQQALQASGTISSIDAAAHTVTVKGLVMSKTFNVPAEAQVMIGGNAAATFNDLKVGDRVDVMYHQQNNALFADRISRIEQK